MASKNWQKVKMVKLIELLRQESDEQHPLTTQRICEHMQEMDIICDRRAVTRDVELLNEIGIEVLSTRVGKKKAYYIDDRSFSIPELKILIDAVQAAGCITEKKTWELTDKIASLGGSHRAEILKNNVVRYNRRKHTNEQIYYVIDAFENALANNKQVLFKYFDIDVRGRRHYRHDGHHYVVEPLALVYNDDNYYSIVSSRKYNSTANSRVDKMDSVSVLADDISHTAISLRSEIGEVADHAIKMYGGPLRYVILEFDSSVMGAVYDRFGESTTMQPTERGTVTASVKVQIAPTFWGWLFQFGTKMRIVYPEDAAAEYRELARQVADNTGVNDVM